MSTTDDKTVEIEGLLPWLDSGELPAILRTIAEWYEGSRRDTNMAVTIKPWNVSHEHPELDLLASVHVNIQHARTVGTVLIWKGADPRYVLSILMTCEATCVAASAKAKGRTYVEPPRFELRPKGGTP